MIRILDIFSAEFPNKANFKTFVIDLATVTPVPGGEEVVNTSSLVSFSPIDI
jgi:hypothetical protein